MPVPPPRPPRRALLLGALVGVGAGVVAACGTGGSPDPADEATAPDAALATEALALARALLEGVDATAARHPGLRDELAALRASHEALADVLADVDATGARPTSAPPDVPPRPGPARQQVVEAERDAVTTYVELAGESEGGRLARVLASAAAGITQALARLDPDGTSPVAATDDLDGVGASSSTVEALQVTLAAEHAAVWTLPVVGARPFGSDDAEGLGDLPVEVDAAYDAHLARRDQLVAALTAGGHDPVPAAPAYESPVLGDGVAPRRRAAVAVEDATAATYASLVAGTAGERRSWAVVGLLDAATRGVDLGGDPQPLPGT